MAEALQATCSSLSPKLVCFFFQSVAGSSSSLSFSPNFFNCSSRKSTSVYVDNPRSHFSVSQPMALGSKVKGYLSKLRRLRNLRNRIPFSALLSLSLNPRGCHKTVLGQSYWLSKVAYPMLEHLPRSGTKFLCIFNHSWSLGFFLASEDLFYNSHP